VSGEKHIEVKVGILVVVCLALLVTFIVVLGGVSSSQGATLYVDVDTSATLKVGAPVKVAGVPSGKVVGVEYRGGAIDPAVGRPVFVRVTLTVDEAKLATLRRDTRFYITNQGVLGEKYVEIEPVSSEGPTLAANEVVVGEPPLRLEIMAMNGNRVLASLSNVLRKNERAIDEMIVNAASAMATVKTAVDRVDGLLVTAGPKVETFLAKATILEDELLKAIQGINAVIGDGKELRGLVSNISLLAADARSQVSPIAASVKEALERYTAVGKKAEGMLAALDKEVNATLGVIQGVLSDAKSISETLKSGQGTIGALLTDREMYDDIREMMKDLKRHPWKFIWKE
jgi:phospholipid/cholesterol/gamma-HCH transport system substrate-binding protein